MNEFLIVGTESDNPFAIDIGRFMAQHEDISDLISLKTFANSEFCPRFIPEIGGETGHWLDGKAVVIVSTASAWLSRDALAMRNLLVARAARDNGAGRIILVEPDLFYSAQDRGPRPEHGRTSFTRSREDFAKFEGQPFSARLYAEALRLAGVDTVVTVHNHSASVGHEFRDRFPGGYFNLSPAWVLAHYIRSSDILDTAEGGRRLVVCAPDKGAHDYAREVRRELDLPEARFAALEKERTDERLVHSMPSAISEVPLEDLAGKDVVIVDDMVRTGGTIVECCRHLRQAGPRRVVFAVTHFYSSEECRENLTKPFLDEIVTTNSVPTILNRDSQGRLRRKMVVLKLEKWIAGFLSDLLKMPRAASKDAPYAIDMSTKNPRWRKP